MSDDWQFMFALAFFFAIPFLMLFIGRTLDRQTPATKRMILIPLIVVVLGWAAITGKIQW